MKFTETRLPGAYILNLEPIVDERGFFARSWCRKEFEEQGLPISWVQCGFSFNQKKGTLRGLHYQGKPYEENKLIRCTRGCVYDVFVDLRPNSSTYLEWISVELTPLNHQMVLIPPGFAHGFQTLEDNTEVFYQISEFYKPEFSRGIRWNAPALGISWPIPNPIVSERDQSFPSNLLISRLSKLPPPATSRR